MTSLHDAARQYVAEGFRVFPLQDNGKEPISTHGVKDASNDLAQIDAWWTAHPNANIGISPGDTGCFVIDCDVKTVDGIAAWHGIAGENTGSTRVSESGTGGRHYWYKGVLRNSASKIAPGIDTRGIGGYVVAPPSVVNGKPYKWLAYAEPRSMDDALYVTVQERVGGSGLREIREAEHPELIGTEHAVMQGAAYVSSLITAQDFPQVGSRDEHATRVFIQLYCLGLDRDQMVDQYARLLAHGGVQPDDEQDLLEKIDRLLEGRVACNAQGSELLPLASTVFEGEPGELPLPPTPPGVTKSGRLGMRPFTEIPIEDIDWIAKGLLARGKVHVLAGKAGIGKSTIAFNLFAAITNGGWVTPFPTGETRCAAKVVVWSGEDDYGDTIVPRMIAAGADLSRCLQPEYIEDSASGRRSFDPATDIPDIKRYLDENPGVEAVLVDPLVAMFGNGVDSHNNAQARSALQPLKELAEEYHIAVIGITHIIKKNDSAVTLQDVSGSLAVTAMPRVVLGVGGGVMTILKSNIGETGGGYPYSLEQIDGISPHGKFRAQRIVWGSFVEGSPEELTKGEGGSVFEKIELWLMHVMNEAGDRGRTSKSIRDEAENKMQFKWPSVRAVSKRLGIVAEKKIEAATNGIAASKKPEWHWMKKAS